MVLVDLVDGFAVPYLFIMWRNLEEIELLSIDEGQERFGNTHL